MSPGSAASTPRAFRIAEDPVTATAASCLTAWRDGGLSIEELALRLDARPASRDRTARDVSDEIEWATFGQRVLRDGRVAGIDEIAGEFYDARHVLAFDHQREAGERIRQDDLRRLSGDASSSQRPRAWAGRRAARPLRPQRRRPRPRDALFVVQREGTIEEIGQALATPAPTTA